MLVLEAVSSGETATVLSWRVQHPGVTRRFEAVPAEVAIADGYLSALSWHGTNGKGSLLDLTDCSHNVVAGK